MRKETTKEKSKSTYYPDGLPENPSRLAIFQCYDKDGIIDDYIPYLLRDLKENLSRLVIVVNGTLTAEGRKRLEAFTSDVFVREDMGFDVAAWKETMIKFLGWDTLEEYDELILLNDTFFGPLYPFREVFEEMNHHPVDFWGLTAHAATVNPYPYQCPYPYLPKHIQSYFIAVRKKMFTSYEFKKFWEARPLFTIKDKGIVQHEVVFTKHFEDVGFTWEVFCDMSDLDGEFLDGTAVNHYGANIYELLTKRKYPVIKKSNFWAPYNAFLESSNGYQLRKSLDYISQCTDYDTLLIYKNVLRTYNITDIFLNLHLNYILPKDCKLGQQGQKYNAVMIFHISYIDMLDYLYPYISGLPSYVDVVLTTKLEKNLDVVRQRFLPVLGNRLRMVLAKDLERDWSALLVAAKEYLNDYDYIGFCHDKKPLQSGPVTVGMGFQELIVENTIGSGAYVENVLNLLDSHPELGFLSPPPPNHGSYFWAFGVRFWGEKDCITNTKALAKQLGLSVDISEEKISLANVMAFWCKRDALAPLFEYPWTYEDFPSEPVPLDGTMGHGLERIFPFVAQHQGYLSGWVMTNEYAELEINNIHCRVDQLLHGDAANATIGVKGALVIYFKKHLPKPLWGIAKKIKRLLRW